MKILVDADACPAKDEIVLVCKRHNIVPTFVANADIPALARNPDAQMKVVSGNFDAADDWIIAQARPGDLVLTADLLLAQRAARQRVDAMSFSGAALTDDVIHDLVARRNIQQHLREMNVPCDQPVPYNKQSRSRLKAALHEWLERLCREQGE
jgi:uncharacterized protein YaiI (UPF0178 family)